MAKIVAYQVQNDGNWDPVAFSKRKLKNKKEVFIIVDDERKELWIWIGNEADVRSRFISSTVAASIRRMYGLTLRVRSADQGVEPDEFWRCIEGIPPEGLGPEEINDGLIEKTITESHSSLSSRLIKFKKKSVAESTKRAIRKKTKQTTAKKVTKIPKSKEKKAKSLMDFIEGETSLITTPLCPRCQKGHLLPYSQVVNVTTRRKDVLPIAKWVCSNCKHSPEDSDSD
ncbi:MAG: hypothetical protein ACFE8U_11935 [Candidatus Hermodarchaeota archaeon]